MDPPPVFPDSVIALPPASGGQLVDLAHRPGGELVVGGLLLVQVLLEHRRTVLAIELPRPRDQRADAGDLVVLDRLRRGDQGSVQDVLVTDVARHVIGLLEEAVDRQPVRPLRLSAVHLEHPIEPPNLAMRLGEMSLEAPLELRAGCVLDHRRQSLREPMLGVAEVRELVEEEIVDGCRLELTRPG